MKFCCSKFEGGYYVDNNFGINIRIVKFSSDFLVNQSGMHGSEQDKMFRMHKKRNDIRFFMTMGYKTFSLELATANIEFCPFCGANLHKFYDKNEYANEIEGETFVL